MCNADFFLLFFVLFFLKRGFLLALLNANNTTLNTTITLINTNSDDYSTDCTYLIYAYYTTVLTNTLFAILTVSSKLTFFYMLTQLITSSHLLNVNIACNGRKNETV